MLYDLFHFDGISVGKRRADRYGHLDLSLIHISLIVFSGFVGRLVRKKNRDEETDTWEKVKVSNKLDFLKDMSILMSIVMIVVYIFTALMAGTEVVSELAGGQNIIVYAVIQAMTFVAGVLVLLQGVRMFLGEIIPAFKGISEKLIPGARPALDLSLIHIW